MSMSMNRSSSRGLFNGSAEDRSDAIDWELRPGGMLVQRRDDGATAAGPMIKVKVSHGSYQHEISIPAQATFGDLKKLLAQETGLEPQEQRLLFRGKEKENDECLHIVGVKDMAKVILLEDPASKERKLEEMKRNQSISKACQAIALVRDEVDKLSEQVRRVQNYVETMDALKSQNANPLCNNTVAVTTRWETFDSGVGSLNAPPPSASTKITKEWEVFD